MSEETRQWCQTSKGQHYTGIKHLCFPPKYIEALRSGNPLRAQLEQTNHSDIIIHLPATCIYHGNTFPYDTGDSSEGLPAGKLKARDYPSLLIPHQLLHPVLSSLICRKGTSKWEQIQHASKMVRGTGTWGSAQGPHFLKKKQFWGHLRSHLSLRGGHHDTFWSPSRPEWLHQSKYLYLCWQ